MNTIIKKIKDKINSNPKGLYVLFYTEAQELFGRFGITALLVLYLTKTFHIKDARAFTIYSAFIALNYITPLLGGFVSDRFLGFKKAVTLGGIIMAFGSALMVIPDPEVVYLGLAIVAVGSGLFTPTLAAMVGRLYPKTDKGRDTGFTIYYIGKNVGALLAPLLCGIVGQYFGFNYAFVLSALGMASGVVVFSLGKKHLPENIDSVIDSKKTKKFYGISSNAVIYGVMALLVPCALLTLQKSIDGYLLTAAFVVVAVVMARLLIKLGHKERRNIFFILFALILVVIFSAFLGQGGTTLNLFIDRIVNRHVLGITIPTSVFYTLDPVFMILLGPVLAFLFVKLAKHGFKVSEVAKFACALLILSLGFMVFVMASSRAINHGHVSMLYVVLAYMLFPIAELCIMPIGLSLVTRYAPRNLEAMMVGIFMLASALASYLTGMISKVGQINFNFTSSAGFKDAAGIYLHLFLETAVVLAAVAILVFLAKPLLRKLVVVNDDAVAVTPTSTAMEL